MLQFSEANLVRSICRESFFEFIKEFWETIDSADPVWNWHIKYMCDEVQAMAERVFLGLPRLHDLIINIPPGTTKSMTMSVMFPAWVWTRFPIAKFVTASYKESLAMDLSRKNKDVVTSDKYRAVFPEIKLRADQAVKTHFQNTHGGFRVAFGTGSPIGFHGHFIIVDDPIDPEGVSETAIRSANVLMDQKLSTRMVSKDVSPTILIMQRLHQDDPTAHMLAINPPGAIKHICLPAEATGDVRPIGLKSRYVKGLLDPVRMTQKALDRLKLRGEYFYSGQFLQNPIPAAGGMFKTERIRIEQTPPVKLTKIIRYWDTAATAGGGAYTVGVKMAKNGDGTLWVLDVKRGRWDAAARNALIKQVAQMDGKEVIVGFEQEPGGAGKEAVENITRMLMGFRTRSDRPTGDKVVRADPYASQVNAGNVKMVAGKWNADYVNELSYFPMSKFKDQVDASSGAVKLLTKQEPFVGVIKTR